METYTTDDLFDTLWIDGLQRQVKFQKQALPELMLWCDKIEDESTNGSDGRGEMKYIFRKIIYVVQSHSSFFTNK